MALHEKNNSQGYFFSLKHGGFTLEADKPTEGFTETEVNNPRTGEIVTKYLKTYPHIDGKITRIDWYDREHQGTRYVGIKIIIHDGSEVYSIDLPFGKRHYNYFMRVMDSIDYTKPVDFFAKGKKDEQGRAYTEFWLQQDGAYLQQNYTRANPGECPLAIKDDLGNWDSRDRHIWLRDRLVNYIIPHVAELNATGDADTIEPEPEITHTGTAQQAVSAQRVVSATAALASTAKVYGTPPEDEKEYKQRSQFVDDDIPF